jgi:hypothetical protein
VIGRALAVAAAVSAAACKKQPPEDQPSPPPVPGVREQAERVVDELCRCADEACVTRLASRVQELVLDRQLELKLMQCLAQLSVVAAPADAQIVDAGLHAMTEESSIEPLVEELRRWVQASHPDLAIIGLAASYARSDGTLDPTYGVFEAVLGNPTEAPADDPDRPTGAPIRTTPLKPPRDRGCLSVSWSREAGWQLADHHCATRPTVLGPRCSLAEIWRRALDHKAPEDAVAVLKIGYPRSHDYWQFSIQDPLRKVSLHRRYRDDCTRAVEQAPH